MITKKVEQALRLYKDAESFEKSGDIGKAKLKILALNLLVDSMNSKETIDFSVKLNLLGKG